MSYKPETTWGDVIFVYGTSAALIACSFYLFMLAITDWWG